MVNFVIILVCSIEILKTFGSHGQMVSSRSMDEGQPVGVKYLDFKKAFDTGLHKRLLKELSLSAYGLKG